MTEQNFAAAGIKGSSLIHALAMFNELCSHEEFFGNDKSKEFAKRIIEIDQKTPLFKEGDYVFAMMLVAEELRFEHLVALSMFTRDGLSEAERAFKEFSSHWEKLVFTLKEVTELVVANEEGSVAKLQELYKSLAEDYENARALVESMDVDMSISTDNHNIWKDIISEKALKFIRDMPDPDTKPIANKKLYAIEEKFKNCVTEQTAAFTKLSEAINSVDEEDVYDGIKHQARQVSIVIRGLLQELSKLYSPVYKACSMNGMLTHRYRSRAAQIKRAVDKLHHAYEASLKKAK